MPTTILVADDDPAILAVCQDILELDGYLVLTVTNGQAAVHLAQAQRPALVLMDIHMPEMDGIAACRRLRQLPATAGVRVILMSAAANLAAHSPALQCADAVLAKPFDLDRLLVAVEQLIAA